MVVAAGGLAVTGRAWGTPRTLTGQTAVNGVVSLSNSGNWGGTLPQVNEEAEIPNGYSTGTAGPYLGVASNGLTFGDLLIDSAQALTIGNLTTGTTNYSLQLGGADTASQANADGATANPDLLLMGQDAVGLTDTVGGNVGGHVTGSTAGKGVLNLAMANDGSFDVASATSTLVVTAAVSGKFALTKAGAGTLVMAGANTYTGTTTVAAGTLRVNNATGAKAVVVAARATLGGTGGTGTVDVNGTITAGPDAATVGTLTTGAQTWEAGGAYLAKLTGTGTTAGTVADQLAMSGLAVAATRNAPFAVTVSGSLTLAAGAQVVLAKVTTTSGTDPFASPLLAGALTLSSSSTVLASAGRELTLASVPTASGFALALTDAAASPEPTSAVLLTAAAAPLLLGRRRRAGH